MLEMGVPETMPSYMSVGIKPVFQEAFQNGGCKITCNGKPAWFKGQFPCFGKLAVGPQVLQAQILKTALRTTPCLHGNILSADSYAVRGPKVWKDALWQQERTAEDE